MEAEINFKKSDNRFNDKYFNGKAYENYEYDRHYFEFIKNIMSIIKHFNYGKKCSCGNPILITSFLDVGCALGYYVKGMKEFETLIEWPIDVAGIDISKYAIDHADTDVQHFLTKGDILKIPYEDNKFDLVLCKDVLEHIPENDIDTALYELKRVSKKYVVVGTVTAKVEWDHDETHINIKPVTWWMDKFKQHGLSYIEARPNFVGFWEAVFILEKVD